MEGLPAYEFRFGDLYHVSRDARICATGESIALVVGADGTVYKHGAEGPIRHWLEAQTRRSAARGMDADPSSPLGLALVAFPATEQSVAALNDLIHGYGSVDELMRRLSALAPLPARTF